MSIKTLVNKDLEFKSFSKSIINVQSVTTSFDDNKPLSSNRSDVNNHTKQHC